MYIFYKTIQYISGETTDTAYLLLFQIRCGEVDKAIGGDQGGSIRIPAAWSGIGREVISRMDRGLIY